MSQTQTSVTSAIPFVDRILYCKDCREPFVFSTGEQRFFREKGLKYDPAPCKDCRRYHKRRVGA